MTSNLPVRPFRRCARRMGEQARASGDSPNPPSFAPPLRARAPRRLRFASSPPLNQSWKQRYMEVYMGFWIYMLLIDFILPLTMIGFGRYFSKKTFDKPNSFCGYRTRQSMRNRDTWRYAHHMIGMIWFISGIILLPVSVGGMLFWIGKSTSVVGRAGAIICGIQLAVLLIGIIPTELALKRRFDRSGRRRDVGDSRETDKSNPADF